MSRTPKPFASLPWSPELALAMEAALSRVHALDARISSSILLRVWQTRAALTGYAEALRLQQLPIEEVDVFSHFCDVRLPGRAIPDTSGAPYDEFAIWERRLQAGEDAHWRECLPFSFETPEGWDNAPKIVRALTLFDAWVRTDQSKWPWLQLPILLHQFGVTYEILPNLVVGTSAQRNAATGRADQLISILRRLATVADTGISRFSSMEEGLLRYSAAVRDERRPGKMEALGRLLWIEPILRPKKTADRLGMTVAGAGKLLQRAASLGLLIEISERISWKAYVTPDVGQALGLVSKPIGRPRRMPAPPVRIRETFDALASQ